MKRGKPEWADQKWQRAAHTEVRIAIQCGELASLRDRKTKCVDCGGIARMYDHRNYALPLMVSAVCGSCNYMRGPAKWPRGKFKGKLVKTIRSAGCPTK